MARTPAAYPIVMGDARLGETYGGVLGLPLTYLIDPRGHIVERFQGVTDLAKMEAQIRRRLTDRRH
jgi:peroxiredoxin